MDIPSPLPGLVLRYAYLWADEHDSGREEGAKDRPVTIVLSQILRDGKTSVLVLPVTHSPPLDPAQAMEIPQETKRRLGLDADRSWILLTETNLFAWPGPDLRPVPGKTPKTVAYGHLPAGFFRAVRDRLLALHSASGIRQVPRTQ